MTKIKIPLLSPTLAKHFVSYYFLILNSLVIVLLTELVFITFSEMYGTITATIITILAFAVFSLMAYCTFLGMQTLLQTKKQ